MFPLRSVLRDLSRLPMMYPHMAESRRRATAYSGYHGRLSTDTGDGGAAGGASPFGGIVESAGGGSGAGDFAVVGALDEPSDRHGALGRGGHGPAVALAVRTRWGGRDPRAQGAGRGSREGAGGACRGERGALRRGERSAELDLAPLGRRDPPTKRHTDLDVAVECDPAEKGGFRWRRPRHTLNGRQDADAVDRAGLRLKLLKMQAEANDIVLLSQDESEALTHPYLAHVWAKRGADLRVPAPGQARKVAMIGALDHLTRPLIVHTTPPK